MKISTFTHWTGTLKTNKLFPIFIGILLFITHLLTLELPMWTYDDACFADYAMNGYLKLWVDLLPGGLKFFIHNTGIWDSWFIHMRVVSIGIELFGPGLWQVRIGPFIVHCLAITSLFFILRLKIFSGLAKWGLFFYATSSTFFYIGHSARPEGGVLLACAISLAWFLFFNDRIASFLAGLLIMLFLGFHSNALIAAISIVLLFLIIIGPRSLTSEKFIYWAIGCAMGLIIYSNLFDIDNIIYCFQINGSRLDHNQFPILKFNFDLMELLINSLGIYNMTNGVLARPLDAWNLCWNGTLFSLFVSYTRRFKQLKNHEKSFILINITIFLWLSLLMPHRQYKYLPIILPWFYINVFQFMAGILNKRFAIDKIDLLLFSSIFLIFLSTLNNFSNTAVPIIAVFFLMIRLWSFSSNINNRFTWFAAIAIFFVYITDPSLLVSIWAFSKYMATQRPILLIILMLTPWLILQTKNSNLQTRRVLLLLFFSFFSLNYVMDSLSIIRKFRSEAALIRRFRVESRALEGKRIVAPSTFWLLNPALTVQCPHGFLSVQKLFPNFDPKHSLICFSPDVIFWHSSRKKTFDNQNMGFMVGPSFETPMGSFLEISIKRENKNHVK